MKDSGGPIQGMYGTPSEGENKMFGKYKEMQARIEKLEAALADIAEFTFCKPGFRCDRCNATRRKALVALKESDE